MFCSAATSHHDLKLSRDSVFAQKPLGLTPCSLTGLNIININRTNKAGQDGTYTCLLF